MDSVLFLVATTLPHGHMVFSKNFLSINIHVSEERCVYLNFIVKVFTVQLDSIFCILAQQWKVAWWQPLWNNIFHLLVSNRWDRLQDVIQKF